MLNENGACHMMVSLVLQLCMFLGIAMGKILCYDNCMMKNILKNKKFWKIICILAIIAYTAKNLFIGADTDEGYGIMVGYRLAMGCLKCGSHTRLPPFLRQFLSGCL